MLRAWTTPGWALIGGLLAVIEFGPLNQWMNSYWGGAVSACAGCLVFGALPRLRESGRASRRRVAGLGPWPAVAHAARMKPSSWSSACCCSFYPTCARLARPAVIAAARGGCPRLRSCCSKTSRPPVAGPRFPTCSAAISTACRPRFTIQPLPTPHLPLTREQQLDYDAQSEVHGAGTDSLATYWRALGQPLPLLSLLPARAAVPGAARVSPGAARVPIRLGYRHDLHLQPGNELLSVFLLALHCRPDLSVRPHQRGGPGTFQPLGDSRQRGGRRMHSHPALSLRGAFHLLVWIARLAR